MSLQLDCHTALLAIKAGLSSSRTAPAVSNADKMTPHYVKVKVKFSRYRPGVAQRVGTGIALFFHDRGTRRG